MGVIVDRRVRVIDIPKGIEIGVARVTATVVRVYSEHELDYKNADSATVQTEEELLPHCKRVGDLLAAMGPEEERSVRYTAGFLHDFGKTKKEFEMYRLKRPLTKTEKRAVRKHDRATGDHIKEIYRGVRAEDQPFWLDVYYIARNHHTPWRVLIKRLRLATWDAMLADIFDAITNPRGYREVPLTVAEALIEIRDELKRKVPLLVRILCYREINQSYARLLNAVLAPA